MWSFASGLFLLAILRIDASSMWYEGYDEKECRSDGACRCKDLTDGSIFLNWREGINACACFMNRKAAQENCGSNGCIPKCTSDGWYEIVQSCDGHYFCSDKNGNTIESTISDTLCSLDCCNFEDDD